MFSFQAHTNLLHIEVFKKKNFPAVEVIFYIKTKGFSLILILSWSQSKQLICEY